MQRDDRCDLALQERPEGGLHRRDVVRFFQPGLRADPERLSALAIGADQDVRGDDRADLSIQTVSSPLPASVAITSTPGQTGALSETTFDTSKPIRSVSFTATACAQASIPGEFT